MITDKYASRMNGTTVFVKGYSASIGMHLLLAMVPPVPPANLRTTVPLFACCECL